MSADSNDEEDFVLNPEDVVRVIDLDEDGNIENEINFNGNRGDYDEDDDDIDDDAMDTGEEALTFTPTQDDSALTFSGHQDNAVICCQLHPLNTDIAVTGGQDDKAMVWNNKSGALLFECKGHSDTVNAVGFSADGTMVASGDMKGLVQVWAVPSGALLWSFEVGEIEWLQWHQVANVLLAGTKDGDVWMWKVPSGECKTFASHGSPALCGQMLPDGKHCCVGYEDGQIKIWDLKGAEVVFTVSGHEAHRSSVLCMDVGTESLVTGSDDMTVKVISLATGKVTSTLQCGATGQGDQTDSVEAVGLSPINGYLATGTLNGRLEVWDLSTKAVRHQYQHPYGIVKIQWSASSPIFYTACLDGCIRQFDSQSGDVVKKWQGHTAGLLDLSLAKDESVVMTTSDDFTAKVFSLANQS